LALMASVVLPLAAYPASRLTAALLRRTREGQHALGQMAAQMQEGLGAVRTLQVFNAQESESQRFKVESSAWAKALNRAAWARSAIPGLTEVLASVAIALILTWGRLAPSDLVSFLGALVLMYQPAKALGRVSQFALTAGVALERIEALLTVPDIAHRGTKRLPPLSQSIVLHEVSFSWAEKPALSHVSLTIPVGRVTALVGESGSGKSTIVSLLLRFEVPQSGTLFFDGVDVAQASLESIRSQFALVTQESLLFSGSVRDNLLLARPQASPEEIEDALRTALAWDMVQELPSGLDTRLGERGVTLSGGQRQRLCLARAVLAQAPVLVLDEATSNLDSRSEREVQLALESVLVGRSAVVIAHRLQHIQKAHQIVVLYQGQVVEQGTHAQLLAAGGHYAELWSAAEL
jgi:subfamily B ATP-binding cassette protein MsbA